MSRHFQLVTASLVILLSASAWGQWSRDPQKNSAIADILGAEQVQPHIAVAADGSWWFSWFSLNPKSAAPQGYGVYLQRLDANGTEQFAHQGIEVAKLGVNWTEDYGLTTDTQGSALLTFLDDRHNSPSWAITATKINRAGIPLWAIQTSASGDAPNVAVLPDGQSIVAWTSETGIAPNTKAGVHLRKLDSMGQPVWLSSNGLPLDLVLAKSGYNYRLADLQAAGDGTVIVSFVGDHDFDNPKHLYANKISADGQLLWGTGHVKVFDGGTLQTGDFPRFVLDERGGAVFAWYSVGPKMQVYTQHVQADGNTSFAHNGVAVSTNLQQARIEPAASYQATTGEITLFWTELDSRIQQKNRGLYAQKIDARGARLWGETGLPIRPLGQGNVTDVRSISVTDGTLVFWVQTDTGSQNNSIQAIKLDAWGYPLCAQFAVSTRPSNKSRLTTSLSSWGQTMLAWQDKDSNRRSDIYLQSVRANCALG